MRQHFIGFADLPQLLQGVPADTPVYVNLFYKDTYGKGKFSALGSRTAYLTVQVIDRQHAVRYVMQRLSATQIVNGQPWDGEREKMLNRVGSAEDIVKAVLGEWGYTAVDAQIDMPKSLEHLTTTLSCLRYDKDTDRYVRADEPVEVHP